ncbi:MAG TPA: CinA family protein [Aggregatilineales bacterium]|nr:CinA family protein [Aggregatilineales bacterium]
MTENKPLANRTGVLLLQRNQTLATAESCTGGLIGHRITEVSGSSAYFMGGVVTYSNEAKMRFLNVQESTLMAVGAVSEEVAYEMAQGAKNAFQTDFALSVTGIAGPSGGTLDKPVGLTYIGLATPEGVTVQRHVWEGDRSEVKSQSADAALQMLLDYLMRMQNDI